MTAQGYGQQWNRGPNYHLQDYSSNWGYVIVYLIVILVSLLGNGLFLFTVKKNPRLKRTPHYMLASLALRDLIVSLLVVPFVIDSQAVNQLKWKAGGFLCKFYAFLNHGTIAFHGFVLVFLSFFLYFWYRNPETFTQEGQTNVRKTKMHKWAIPLAVVIGLGLAIPAGALSSVQQSSSGVQTCSLWNGFGSNDNHKVAVSLVFVTFFLPLVLLAFPFTLLAMQFFKCREPRLDPPHNLTVLTTILLCVVFVGTMAPFQIYEASRLFSQSVGGFRLNQNWNTPRGAYEFNTDIILSAIMYASCAIHPILYFLVNPDYRAGLKVVWRELYCNKDPAQREREAAAKRQQRAMQRQQYSRPGSAGSNRPIIRGSNSGQPLLTSPQPQIMMAPTGAQHNQFYPPSQGGTLQPLLPQGGQQPHILFPDQHFIDTSFEGSLQGSTVGGATSPQLPAVFEYNGLKYIDTARVEPRIAYSPEKTPPKTPETPHFGIKPFRDPLDAANLPINQEAFVMASPLPPAVPLPGVNNPMEPSEISPPIATSETKSNKGPRPSSMTLEELDSSPGNTLRDRHRRGTGSGSAGLNTSISPPISPRPVESPVPVVEALAESPGNKKRQRAHTNGHNFGSSSQPTSSEVLNANSSSGSGPIDRPSSRASQQNAVEIVIQGRTRSRTDLCPDAPRSKFEHAV